MITLCRSAQRHHTNGSRCHVWRSRAPRTKDATLGEGFEILAAFSEVLLLPAGASPLLEVAEAELLTYVFRGSLVQEDPMGDSDVLHPGEFQRRTVTRHDHHREVNASPTDGAHSFRIALNPSQVGRKGSFEHEHFGVALRHNILCAVASPDGRRGSLHMKEDALILSSVLDPGRHVVHALARGHSAWLHIVHGEANLDEIVLTRGDGAGITLEPSVSLTATMNSEILLVDVGPGGSPRQDQR